MIHLRQFTGHAESPKSLQIAFESREAAVEIAAAVLATVGIHGEKEGFMGDSRALCLRGSNSLLLSSSRTNQMRSIEQFAPTFQRSCLSSRQPRQRRRRRHRSMMQLRSATLTVVSISDSPPSQRWVSCAWIVHPNRWDAGPSNRSALKITTKDTPISAAIAAHNEAKPPNVNTTNVALTANDNVMF